MSKSHAAARTSEKPTFAQITELFRQFESGRISKDGLQKILRRDTSPLSPDNTEMVDVVEQNVMLWQANFPGHERALISRMSPLLDCKEPLKPRKPDREKWNVFKRSIFWDRFDGVLLVDRRYLARDYLDVPIEYLFAQSIVNELEPEYSDRLEVEKGLIFKDMECLLFSLPAVTGQKTGGWHKFKLDGMLGGARFQWLIESFGAGGTLHEYLANNLCVTMRVVATLLILNERVEDAYTLLEMWCSGNYPIGFNRENQLVVLCA